MNENIFRAYDIRGIYGEELDEKTSYYIGVAFGNNIKNRGKTVAVVGYDNRTSSIPLSEKLIEGITDTGIGVINIGLVTTAMFLYALEYLKIPSGIVVTASHSPTIYNGMKIHLDETGRIHGGEIQNFKEEVKVVMEHFSSVSKGIVKSQNIRDAYLQMLSDKVKLGNRKIKVVIDCGNGTGSIVAVEAFRRAGCEVIPLFCDSNPLFPNHHPDPAVEKNMLALEAKVVAENADLGIGFDGDVDRVGIINELGQMVYGDMIMAILCREVIPRLSDKKALLDIKCSKALEDEIVKLGGKAVYSRTGHSYMVRIMRKDHFVIGGELAGHIYLADEFYGYDDGMYVALRLLRIFSNTNKPFSSLLDGLNKYYATPEIIVKTTDTAKFDIVDKVRAYASDKNYEMLTIDGIRVLFNDGWALVRPSNTGPNITLRFEAVSEQRLEEIKGEFMNVLDDVMSKY